MWEYPVTDAAEEAKVGRDTAIDMYQWFWEVCSTKLTQTPIQVGGPGKVVEMDESLSGTSLRYGMINR